MMKTILVVVVLASCLFVHGSFAADKQDNTGTVPLDKAALEPGKTVKIDDPLTGGGKYWSLYVPKDYTPDRAWPIIYSYHGAGQEATVWPFRKLTDGVGFIVVGMEYTDRGIGEQRTYNELADLKRIRGLLARRLKINDKLQFIAGFSRGGWETSDLAEHAPGMFAGIIITGAGRASSKDSPTVGGVPIFIGVGERDTNRQSAEAAADFYRKKGAKVTFEIFKGTGHGVDTKNAALKSWLKDQTSPPARAR